MPDPSSRALRGLVLGLGDYGIEGAMVEPLRLHRRVLRREFGLKLSFVTAPTLAAVEAAVARQPLDLVFVLTDWRADPVATTAFFERWSQRPRRPRIVYLDFFDSTASPFFGILPFVDVYAKKQLLTDRARYRSPLAGGFVFTDHLARRGVDLEGWQLGSELPAEFEHRLVLSWNLGASRAHARRLASRQVPFARRPIDLHCAINLGRAGGDGWYTQHRRTTLEQLSPIAERHRAVLRGHLDGEGLPRRRFLREMAQSRLVVSPFGWGELCVRDFEALSSGCLLVKPDVGHLDTAPDLFVAGETYVPVAWDGSDLVEVCEHYLARPAECERVIAQAQQRYRRYFEERRVLDSMREIVTRAVRFAREGCEDALGRVPSIRR